MYIVILNYKNWHDVVDCLYSVFRSNYSPFKVFVIDNDSQNASLQHLMDWAEQVSDISISGIKFFHSGDLHKITDVTALPPLVFIQNERNSGFAGGNNIVLRLLAGQNAFVWLLNPDMVIENVTLSELVNFAQAQPSNCIIGSVVKFQNRPEKIHMYGGGRILFKYATISFITKKDEMRKLDYISGGSLFTHANQFKEIGLLPEKYFLYWEETDWCYGARMKGSPLSVCLSSVCYDKGGTSIGRGFLAEFYYTRNGLLFLSKYKKENIRFALFFSMIRVIKKIMTGDWKRASGVYKGVASFMKMNSHANK